jgi:hypothetical protein
MFVKNSFKLLQKTPQNPFFRTYKKCIVSTLNQSAGRSILVTGGNVQAAFSQLNHILNENNIKKIVRSQQRFISNPAKKRLLRKEKEFGIFLEGLKSQVRRAKNLKYRTEHAKKTFEEL